MYGLYWYDSLKWTQRSHQDTRPSHSCTGASVELLQVDVSNLDKLSEALSTRNSLTGIIHAAGIVRDCRLEHLDWKRFLEVLKPKVHGAYFLHQLLKERKLSVFCMFSSWSASFGVEGQCNYMSANSFLDALAHYRQEDGLCGQSLAWSAWGEVGMARGLRLPKGMVAMPVSLALKAFFDVLTMPDPHIVLVHDDGTLRNGSPTFHDGQRRTPKGQSDLDFLPVILKAISDLESWQTDKEVDCEEGFTDLGLDSLDISILSNLISEETGINVSWHDMFSHPSCKELANFLAQQARLQLPESHECGVVEGGAGSAGKMMPFQQKEMAWMQKFHPTLKLTIVSFKRMGTLLNQSLEIMEQMVKEFRQKLNPVHVLNWRQPVCQGSFPLWEWPAGIPGRSTRLRICGRSFRKGETV